MVEYGVLTSMSLCNHVYTSDPDHSSTADRNLCANCKFPSQVDM